MKQIITLSVLAIIITVTACRKPKKDNPSNITAVTSEQVLSDFANILANPNYLDIQTKAGELNTAVQDFIGNPTDWNLSMAQQAWRAVRQPWEQCEAFIFGPVEDFNYDPSMDTWPVDRVSMDSLLASSNPLTLADIDAQNESLKGFHPIEYMLFGVGGKKKVADFTDREKLYLASLTQNLYNTTTELRNSWDVNHGNFTSELVTAGNGSTRYTSRQEALIAIVTAMAGICDEVAAGKMEEPFANQDSTLEESQFAHNSTTDFKNNITGVLNVYLGKYAADGHGLNDLVAGVNISLDNKLKNQINAAINSFNNIDANYGAAIYTQSVQILAAQDAINTLKETLESDLIDFILTNVKD